MGRTQWVNTLSSFGVQSVSSVTLYDMLSSIDSDVRARSTVVAVRGSIVLLQTDPNAVGACQAGLGFTIGPEGGYATDPTSLLPGQDNSWLWTSYDLFIGVPDCVTPQKTNYELNIKTSRRFRTGGQTLWLSLATTHEFNSSPIACRAYVRTLLYIP